MKITSKEILDLLNNNIEEDKLIVENYKKILEIVDKINKKQADEIFEGLINNHEISISFAKKFKAKSNLFANQLKKGIIKVLPNEIQELELLQEKSNNISEERSNIELEIGKKFLEKEFISIEIYNKYYS